MGRKDDRRHCRQGMSDRAVYLGDGVWWQLSNAQRMDGVGRGLPERIRPWWP